MKNEAAKYDRAMAAAANEEKPYRYLTADTEPLRLSGFAFRRPGEALKRLPDDPALSEAVRRLSWHTSGGRIDFRTDSSRISVKVRLTRSSHMDHMPDVGSCGFDLYVGEPGEAVMLGTSRSNAGADEYVSRLHSYDLSRKMRNFTLDLPLYSGIEELLIGVDEDASLLPPAPWHDPRPMVFYGTSITQGGCASRPGMAYTAILSRRFNRPALNFGFSGSGKGEPRVAEYLAQIADPALYLLDYEPNAMPDGIRDTLETFIDILREKHPETPIFVMSCLRFNREICITDDPEKQESTLSLSAAFQQSEVLRRRKAGDRNIHFINGGRIAGPHWHEFSVDGVHQTDLGFYVIANELTKILAPVL